MQASLAFLFFECLLTEYFFGASGFSGSITEAVPLTSSCGISVEYGEKGGCNSGIINEDREYFPVFLDLARRAFLGVET